MIVHQSVRHSIWARCTDKLAEYHPAGTITIHPVGHHGAEICIETDNRQDAAFIRLLIAQTTKRLIASRKRQLNAMGRSHVQKYLAKGR